MLHLQTGVHFHEVEILGLVDQELDRARADITHGLRRLDGRLRHGGAHFVAQARRRRFLDDLLMAALHRAIAVEQADGLSVRVRKDLHFHVASLGKVAFHQQPIVSEGGARQTLRRFHRGRHLRGRIDDLHALAAASGAGLDDQRESDPQRFFS